MNHLIGYWYRFYNQYDDQIALVLMAFIMLLSMVEIFERKKS